MYKTVHLQILSPSDSGGSCAFWPTWFFPDPEHDRGVSRVKRQLHLEVLL